MGQSEVGLEEHHKSIIPALFFLLSLIPSHPSSGAKVSEIGPMGKMLERAKQSNRPQVGAQCRHRLHQEEKPMLIIQLGPHNKSRRLLYMQAYISPSQQQQAPKSSLFSLRRAKEAV